MYAVYPVSIVIGEDTIILVNQYDRQNLAHTQVICDYPSGAPTQYDDYMIGEVMTQAEAAILVATPEWTDGQMK